MAIQVRTETMGRVTDVPVIPYDQYLDLVPPKEGLWWVEDLAVDNAYIVKDGRASEVQHGDKPPFGQDSFLRLASTGARAESFGRYTVASVAHVRHWNATPPDPRDVAGWTPRPAIALPKPIVRTPEYMAALPSDYERFRTRHNEITAVSAGGGLHSLLTWFEDLRQAHSTLEASASGLSVLERGSRTSRSGIWYYSQFLFEQGLYPLLSDHDMIVSVELWHQRGNLNYDNEPHFLVGMAIRCLRPDVIQRDIASGALVVGADGSFVRPVRPSD